MYMNRTTIFYEKEYTGAETNEGRDKLKQKGGTATMTLMTIALVFIIGLMGFVVGMMTKKKWLTILGLVPLTISLWQIIIMFTLT